MSADTELGSPATSVPELTLVSLELFGKINDIYRRSEGSTACREDAQASQTEASGTGAGDADLTEEGGTGEVDLEEECGAGEADLTEKDKDRVAALLQKHIQYYTANKIPMVEFENGCEWFNVSRALSLHCDLQGRVTVLDFFTYCCINCLHVLPDLHALEDTYQDGHVQVVGVHSAKFSAEKVSSNLSSAISRYGISHPVINDSQSAMWRRLGVACWPTLIVLGPSCEPLFVLAGEGHRQELLWGVAAVLLHHTDTGLLQSPIVPLPLSPSTHLPNPYTNLRFPGKVGVWGEKGGDRGLVVSDTGLHRILLCDWHGRVKRIIGSGTAGHRDGCLATAEFRHPHGCVFRPPHMLLVADTGNHAIREVCLSSGEVRTVVGSGKQGVDTAGGGQGAEQDVASPWDVCLAHSPDRYWDGLDITASPNLLLIAMAGTHQIWGLYLDEGEDFYREVHTPGTAVRLAGSGAEENRNNSGGYPHMAGFAQPSGLCVTELPLSKGGRKRVTAGMKSGGALVNSTDAAVLQTLPPAPPPPKLPPPLSKNIPPPPPEKIPPPAKNIPPLPPAKNIPPPPFSNPAHPPSRAALSRTLDTRVVPCCVVADAESSSVRLLRLDTGAVMGLVGGATDPTNLFAYGDKDGVGVAARLQHPLGVTADSCGRVYVVDTYNHKIKEVRSTGEQFEIVTVAGGRGPGYEEGPAAQSKFNEPSGLCCQDGLVYVADTNNHCVRVMDTRERPPTVTKLVLNFDDVMPDAADSVDSADLLGTPSTGTVTVLIADVPPTPETVAGTFSFRLRLTLSLPQGTHLNEEAPSNWRLSCQDDKITFSSTKGRLSLTNSTVVVTIQRSPDGRLLLASGGTDLHVSGTVYACLDSGVCVMKDVNTAVLVKPATGESRKAISERDDGDNQVVVVSDDGNQEYNPVNILIRVTF